MKTKTPETNAAKFRPSPGYEEVVPVELAEKFEMEIDQLRKVCDAYATACNDYTPDTWTINTNPSIDRAMRRIRVDYLKLPHVKK